MPRHQPGHRARRRKKIDARVIPETLVFRRNRRVDERARDFVKRHVAGESCVIHKKFAQRLAVAVGERHARLRRMQQRLRNWDKMQGDPRREAEQHGVGCERH